MPKQTASPIDQASRSPSTDAVRAGLCRATGNAVSCAAGLAVLDVIARDGLMDNAARVGAHLASGLNRLASHDPRIGDIRAAGLFVGVDLVNHRDPTQPAPGLASQVVNELRRRRILISAAGPAGNVLKIRPPLIFTTDQVDLLLSELEAALEVIDTSVSGGFSRTAESR